MRPLYRDRATTVYKGDAKPILMKLPDDSVNCVVTSPPYWRLRDYKIKGQIGLEKTPKEYIKRIVGVFREVKRVLHPDGTLWLNMGDSYASGKGTCYNPGGGKNSPNAYEKKKDAGAYPLDRMNTSELKKIGLKPKDLTGMPWTIALALRDDGWWLRCDVIWKKPNCQPFDQADRPTIQHEYIFLLTKSRNYYYNNEAVMEDVTGNAHPRGKLKIPSGWDTGPGSHTKRIGIYPKKDPSAYVSENEVPTKRNLRSVWEFPSQASQEDHYSTFPDKLPEICIKAGCPEGGVVLDPFAGSGTVGRVAKQLGRKSILIELKKEFCEMIYRSVRQQELDI